MFNKRVSLGLFFLVAGCTVGPDFYPPSPKVGVQWSTSIESPKAEIPSTVSPSSSVVQKWWTTFNDPLLLSLIERAVQSNIDLKQALSRIRQARAARWVAVSDEFPQLNLSGSYRRTDSSFASGRSQTDPAGLTAPSNRTRNLFQGGLDASWELDVFGGIRRQIEAADADVLAREEDRRDLLVTLTAEVAFDYLTLRGLQQRIEITKQNLSAQQGVAGLTEQRYRAGFANALDTANALAQVATTKAQLPPLEAQVQKQIYSLSLLLALEPGALNQELSPVRTLPSAPPEVPVGVPSELLRRRPDIRRAEAELHAATARVGAATADLFPKISLTGFLGFSGGRFTSLGDWANHSWFFGPELNYPLFDAGRTRAIIEIQNELEEQSLLNYERAVLNALREVESALVDYQLEQRHRLALNEAVAGNERALSLAKELYSTGVAEFLNVLNAEQALYQSQDALVQSVTAVDTNLVAIYKALGGGWQIDAEESLIPGKSAAASE